MRLNNVRIIARREYLSRIKTKGFWIGTFLLPLMMLAMGILPTLLLSRAKSTLRVALVDQTGKVGALLKDRLEEPPAPAETPAADAKTPSEPGRGGRRAQLSTFVVELVPPGDSAAVKAEQDRRVLDKKLDAWIWIGSETLTTNTAEYHGESVSNFVTQQRLERILSQVVRDVRVKEAGFDGEAITKVTHPIELETVRITKEGDKAETGMAGFFFAYTLFFLLYIMIMLYGQQVMSGVLEEKTSRIVEVIISTVKPFELMLGKLVGICLVGLTQILIWLITAAVLTAPGAAFALAAMPAGIPTVSPTLILHFAGHFLLGFFLYASFYAALGAAFNDIREAQQAAASATFFLIMPVFLMFMIINDPDSPLAVAASLFPPFTPLLMLLRIAVKMPPAWQIILGYALTTGFVIFMTWTCAKVYRIGILMYGKKPTLKELLRWMRYA